MGDHNKFRSHCRFVPKLQNKQIFVRLIKELVVVSTHHICDIAEEGVTGLTQLVLYVLYTHVTSHSLT